MAKGEEEEREEQLGVDPRVAEAVACRGSLLGYHLQHGQQEMGEVAGVLVRPSVLFNQHVEQRPRLQLGDVSQLACRGQLRAELLGAHGNVGDGGVDEVEGHSNLDVCSDQTMKFWNLRFVCLYDSF